MSANPRRGRFITLEGIDGAGKSTHLPWVKERLERDGREVWATRRHKKPFERTVGKPVEIGLATSGPTASAPLRTPAKAKKGNGKDRRSRQVAVTRN